MNRNNEIAHTSIVGWCHLYKETSTVLALSDYQCVMHYHQNEFQPLLSRPNSQYEPISHSAPNINLHEKPQKCEPHHYKSREHAKKPQTNSQFEPRTTSISANQLLTASTNEIAFTNVHLLYNPRSSFQPRVLRFLKTNRRYHILWVNH